MLIPITPQQDGCPEWAMIELQGDIQLLRDADAAELPVGTLLRKNAETYQLTIGYHQLEGKRVPLKQPMLLLDKQRTHDGVAYHVHGVVRTRLLFKTRPRSLITKTHA